MNPDASIQSRADSLVFTSVDDVKSSMPHSDVHDLPALRLAHEMNTSRGHKTKAQHIARRIRQLEKLEAAGSAAAKVKFPREAACAVARELCRALLPCTTRLIVAGSLRRMKQEVGDVEVLFVPRMGLCRQPGQFLEEQGNMTEAVIAQLIDLGILDYRLTKNGARTYGPKNKLVVHKASGIPVDLFTATDRNWWNYLVCRTGGADHNITIAKRAREQGYQWNPYGEGFTRLSDRSSIEVTSEQHLFEFLNLPWLEPSERS